MSDKRLLIVGAGGHAKVVIEVAQSAGWEPNALFDPGPNTTVLGLPILGSDENLPIFWNKNGADAGMVAIGNNTLRQKLAKKLRKLGCPTPILAHSTACISPNASIGEGTIIMAGAIINAEASIGKDCIVNTGAIVEHDCRLGDGVHVAPRSVMGGGCHLGDGTLFGIGAVARPEITIGKQVIIGAGATVVSNISDCTTVVGNPAKEI